MNHSTDLVVDEDSTIVADVLADLSTYPLWNDLVQAVEPGNGADQAPSWNTILRATVGPFARSKRLRFVRTIDQTAVDGRRLIRFERKENDGRDHAEWIMEAEVIADGSSTLVTLRLSYNGGLYTSILDPILGAAIDRASRRLPEYVSGR